MVLKRTGLVSIVLLLLAACWLGPVDAGRPPVTSFNFSLLGSWESHKIEVDKNKIATYVDKNGNTFKGAVFQVTVTEPVDIKPGVSVKVFVNVVVAACGHDTLLLLNSKAFDENGKQISELDEPSIYEDFKQESTPPTEMYRFLCADQKRAGPKPGSHQDVPRNSSVSSNNFV